MRHSLPIAPQFFVTAPQDCPYLEGRQERKLFTTLKSPQAQALHDRLSKQGFRRSQNVLYRPTCADCAGCMSARIRVEDFKPGKTQRRIAKRGATLKRRVCAPWASEEQYDLFRDYLHARHADGGMADMDVFEFAAMIEESPIRTRVIEYRDGETGELVACCLTDVTDDGLSLVYSFYDPARAADSLGTYVVLDHIEMARGAGLAHVYLGYWVPGSPKMAYKARFSALELYRDGQWQTLEDPARFSADPHPLSTEPVAQQVARLNLPDMLG